MQNFCMWVSGKKIHSFHQIPKKNEEWLTYGFWRMILRHRCFFLPLLGVALPLAGFHENQIHSPWTLSCCLRLCALSGSFRQFWGFQNLQVGLLGLQKYSDDALDALEFIFKNFLPTWALLLCEFYLGVQRGNTYTISETGCSRKAPSTWWCCY